MNHKNMPRKISSRFFLIGLFIALGMYSAAGIGQKTESDDKKAIKSYEMKIVGLEPRGNQYVIILEDGLMVACQKTFSDPIEVSTSPVFALLHLFHPPKSGKGEGNPWRTESKYKISQPSKTEPYEILYDTRGEGYFLEAMVDVIVIEGNPQIENPYLLAYSPGATIEFQGDVIWVGIIIQSAQNDPLIFKITDGNLEYSRGSGTIILPNKTIYRLPMK